MYREELIEQQERNKELADELDTLEEKIRTYEKEFSSNEAQYEQYSRRSRTITYYY